MEDRRSFSTYIVSLLLFGTNGVVAAYITDMGSTQIVLVRTLLGSIMLLSVFLLLKGRFQIMRNKRAAMMLIISGASMGVSWMFQYEAYRDIGIGTTSLIYCCGPAILMGLAPLLFHEKMALNRLAGFTFVMAGAILMSVTGLESGGSTWGHYCGFMTAVAYVSMVIFNKMAMSEGNLENPTVQMTVAFLTVLTFLTIKGDLPSSIDIGDMIPLLILGLLNTGFGCFLYFTSIGRIEAQTVAICDYIEPASAVLFAMLLLGESAGVEEIIGMGLIAAGVIIGFRNRGFDDLILSTFRSDTR